MGKEPLGMFEDQLGENIFKNLFFIKKKVH